VKIVTNDIEERMQYNTAIARMMELVNALYQLPEADASTPDGAKVLAELFDSVIPMLSPFVPHVAEEMWAMLGHKELLVDHPWPSYSEALSMREEMEIVFQVNGKNRSKAVVAPDIKKEEMEKLALGDQRIAEFTEGKQVVKVIVVPGKLVNIVVK
ncbi:MAG: leucine--tRNA ligase, partial [Spirochaetales bacterium]